GFLTDIPTGFPGYDGRIPRSAGTLARILRDAGYNTFAVGKWHLAPRWEEAASGPFDRWPLGLGFERYYGFLAGDTNQWTPDLVCDNHFVEPPRGPAEGYHLTEDLADRAIRYVQDQQQASPGKPFFLYFATGATHAPHQAPAEWTDRYRGRFDAGWEAWRDEAFARQLELGVVPAGTTLADRPHRRARRVPRLQPLRMGLGVGREHSAATLEALHVARRRADASRRALAGARHHRERRPGAVLSRRRPHADDPRCGRRRPAR